MKNTFNKLPLLAVLTLVLPACEDHPASPNARFPERVEFVAQRQYPEGIAYSSQLDRFIITSLTQGKLGTVDVNGNYQDLIAPPELISGIGVKVANGQILVCNSDNGVSSKSTLQTARRTAELLIFSINSRQLERRVDLDDLLPGVNHFANDIAISPEGIAYVTDSFAPVVYQVTSDGQASILVNDSRFASNSFGLNGIVYHPNGFLIVVKTSEGKLFKIDMKNNNTISEINGVTLQGGDGMTLVGNDLYIVTGGGSQVSQVRSTDNWQTASLIRNDTQGYLQATTNVFVDGRIYTLNARIGEIQQAMGNPALLQSNNYSIQAFK